ncbi:hypothetical protein Pmani_004424 [Petrolisthes manimaculis]|uniref:Uncharacterized protein n=1 Tax=Petrolisthes manimaculis TaxID=1843537 RepID=A0AAE1ULK1_9EUCA|nr:hypothetical protein Pmani_004424 [Petrolisthes manimaculis]
MARVDGGEVGSGGRKVEEVNIVRVDQLGWGTNFKAVHYPRLATLSTFPVTMQSLEHHATTDCPLSLPTSCKAQHSQVAARLLCPV